MGEEDLRVRCVFAFECTNVCMHARECGGLVSHVSLHVCVCVCVCVSCRSETPKQTHSGV